MKDFTNLPGKYHNYERRLLPVQQQQRIYPLSEVEERKEQRMAWHVDMFEAQAKVRAGGSLSRTSE